jgi:hypothetical protein
MNEDEEREFEQREQQDRDTDLLKSHVAKLMEHFESVQIFATRHMQSELGGTVNVQFGAGNWFARYGQVRAWVVKEDELLRFEVRQDNEPE